MLPRSSYICSTLLVAFAGTFLSATLLVPFRRHLLVRNAARPLRRHLLARNAARRPPSPAPWRCKPSPESPRSSTSPPSSRISASCVSFLADSLDLPHQCLLEVGQLVLAHFNERVWMKLQMRLAIANVKCVIGFRNSYGFLADDAGELVVHTFEKISRAPRHDGKTQSEREHRRLLLSGVAFGTALQKIPIATLCVLSSTSLRLTICSEMDATQSSSIACDGSPCGEALRA